MHIQFIYSPNIIIYFQMTLGYDVFDVNDVIGESFLNSYPNLYLTQYFDANVSEFGSY